VVAGLGDLGPVAHEVPRPGEDALELQVEDPRVGIDAAIDETVAVVHQGVQLIDGVAGAIERIVHGAPLPCALNAKPSGRPRQWLTRPPRPAERADVTRKLQGPVGISSRNGATVAGVRADETTERPAAQPL